MSIYRTGNHWGTKIIRFGAGVPDEHGRCGDDEAVVTTRSGRPTLVLHGGGWR
ncbi:hypothetical protein AB0F72_09185 [Actinoplanes sp. NPDC023936]|uniref:hypothetical protein n=1 Tax=Actinoplanes sp. NPDC023936 TaxID=3154910 RepID=UPI00340B86B4